MNGTNRLPYRSASHGTQRPPTLSLDQPLSRRNIDTFVVRSIRRGSEAWHEMLQPFVADLAFKSLVVQRHQSPSSFRPYHCQAAVLFVDLSDYSKICAVISSQGAHAISSAVNAYLRQLLLIVKRFGGDVVKFAGDAILVVWEGNAEQLETNALLACQCAFSMQQEAGSFAVPHTTDLCFRIHCGISCGSLESEIFAAPSTTHMQRLYHCVGGEALQDLSHLVNLAQSGQVCVSKDIADFLGNRGTFRNLEAGKETFLDCQLLESIQYPSELKESLQEHAEVTAFMRKSVRKKEIEEEFIHPSVISLLSHGGLSPTQISQMRNLCVLFIAMTSGGCSVNWLMEVQSILDKNRCPLVQILDDDKGVHLVAAINLYEAVPELNLYGIQVCKELIAMEVGCAIGMAAGSTFCGVTGSSKVACRWDVTGPPPVRAARLMQYALERNLEVAIDQSVYEDPMAATKLELLQPAIELKGTTETVPVYKLSRSNSHAAFRVLETVHGKSLQCHKIAFFSSFLGRVHCQKVEEVCQRLRQGDARVAVVVAGAPLAGKKIVCQRAAGKADLVPYLHLSDQSSGFLQLAKTIATWFTYVEEASVYQLANDVLRHLEKGQLSRTHDKCVELIELSLSLGLRSCFLVDRIQFLDEFSLSLIRESLQYKSREQRSRPSLSHGSRSNGLSYQSGPSNRGKVVFLCVHVSLYQWKPASHVVKDITRSQTAIKIPIIEIGEAPSEELRTMFRDLSDMEVEDRWIDAYSEASGNIAGYFIQRAAAVRTISSKLWKEGKKPYAETTEALVLHIPPGLVRLNKKLPVRLVSVDTAMRFSQVYDELPALYQTAVKVLAMGTACYFKLPRSILLEVLDDLIAQGVDLVEFDIVLRELKEMYLIRIERENGKDALGFENPALADVALDVSTPVQIEKIGKALIDRLEPILDTDFRISFIVAGLYNKVRNDLPKEKKLWRKGYKGFWEAVQFDSERLWWMEMIDDEMKALGLSPDDVFGGKFIFRSPAKNIVGKRLPLVKIYSAPVSLGPMGHSLSVITRNCFHEYGVFHGYSDDEAKQLHSASHSAANRYICEMTIIEALLADHKLSATEDELREETKMIRYLSNPADSDSEVQTKAATILDEFVPKFVTSRLERLYKLVTKLRESGIPGVIVRAEPAIRKAYEALRAPKCDTDAAQDALMKMATCNWKPKPVPEYLPLIHYQTVARIRSKVLKRLNDAELFMYRHQQTPQDFEAFLIVTALLYENSS